MYEEAEKNRSQMSEMGGHYHNYYEVYYLIEGTCWYFIDKKSYHLTAGDIALIPKGVIHKTNYETSEHTRLLICCDSYYIPESVRDILPTIPYFAKNGEHTEEINFIFKQIENEITHHDEFSEESIRMLINKLLILIARATRIKEKGKEEIKKEESPIVEKAVKYIRSHYTEEVSLADTAAYCYVSKEHLSRTFKKETGFGFNEYLTAYRLKKAESLIKSNPKVKVSEVALACGFNDSNYFSKVYKRMYGKSPTRDKKTK
jgi:AraC-like DNA-binding protein